MSASASRPLPLIAAICAAGLLSFNLQADDYPTIPQFLTATRPNRLLRVLSTVVKTKE